MNVFISGGTSGIGKALAQAYLAEGHRVGICGGTKEFFKRSFDDFPEGLEFFELDVRQRENCQKVIREFASSDGVDLVVACAGINNGKPFSEDVFDFDRELEIIDVNLKGTMHIFEAALLFMLKKQSGQLVILSSASGLVGFPEAPAYCASKGALLNYGESLAIRLKSKGISVTTLAPGYVDTPLARKTHPHLEKMPFVVAVEKTALIAKEAIENKKVRKVFPYPVAFIMVFLSLIPRTIFVRVYQKLRQMPFLRSRQKGESYVN